MRPDHGEQPIPVLLTHNILTMALDFGNKIQNLGATAQGRLTAAEFNAIIQLINEHDELIHKKWVGSESEYAALVASNQIHDDWLYYIYEDDEPGGGDTPQTEQTIAIEGSLMTIQGAELSADGETLTVHGSLSSDGETLIFSGSAQQEQQEDEQQTQQTAISGELMTIQGASLSQDGETLTVRGALSSETLVLTNT